MFAADCICSSCHASMATINDHALRCHGDPHSSCFRLGHRLVKWTFVSLLRQDGVHHMVEPQHLRLESDDALLSWQGSWLTKPTIISFLHLMWGPDIIVSTLSACPRLAWVGGMILLPFSLWSRARVISMPGPTSYTASTSPP